MFSVPAYGSEWYPRWMYQAGSNENSHHIATYGDPSVWGYNNFIDGANDKAGVFTKFNPKLKSQGGNFDPDEWAQLFLNAGAKFAGPVAEHHDGFSMWDSQVNEWNSVGKGPNLNLASLFAGSIRNKGMKILVRDFERGGPGNLTSYYWLTDDIISSSSWSYTNGIGYYATQSLLAALIDRVSKNGNMLLNIAPMADGSIPQGQKDVLLGMGAWLGQYGEAIYNTRAWVKFGEGPTQMGGGSFQTPREGTASDIRFTQNKAGNTLYAIAMGWPTNNQMVITSLNSAAFNTATVSSISMVGGGTLTWSQDATGLKINLPTTGQTANGYAVRIALSGSIPPLPTTTTAFAKTEAETASNLSGSVRAEACSEGGQNLGWIATGDWAKYKTMDFGPNGDATFEARIAGVSTSGKIDVRLDSPTGPLVGSLTGVNTGGWQTFSTAAATISGATGIHDVYLVFTAGLNLNWFDFVPRIDSAAYYKIVSRNNENLVLDEASVTPANGSNIQVWADSGNDRQQWKFVDAGSGYCQIQLRNNSLYCVDESQVSPADGSNVQIWQYSGNDRQQWKLVHIGGGYFEIQLRNNPNLCLDVSQASPTNGTNVQVWTYAGNDRQQWKLVKVP